MSDLDVTALRAAYDAQLRAHVPDPLPAGIQAFPAREPNEVVLWIESHRAVIAGDTLADFGRGGIEMPPEWLREGVTHEQVAKGLRPLLDLPVEHVLPTHGSPTGKAALERALQP